MFSQSPRNICVKAISEYDVKNSFPTEDHYVFKYTIFIENLGTDSIRVLKRKWIIFDSGYGFSAVAGNGVVGLTPIIEPGCYFSYFSYVVLKSGIGNMKGTYFVYNENKSENFEIDIPKFTLHADVYKN